LEGSGKFKDLFVEKVENQNCGSDTNHPNSAPRCVLMLPEYFHCIKGKEIVVEDDFINKSLLTRKNLSNFIDIKKTLFIALQKKWR